MLVIRSSSWRPGAAIDLLAAYRLHAGGAARPTGCSVRAELKNLTSTSEIDEYGKHKFCDIVCQSFVLLRPDSFFSASL